MTAMGWCVRVVYAGGLERVRTFEGEGEAIDAYRAMARDAKERVDAGRVASATTTIAHRGRVLVGWTMRNPGAAS